MARRICRTNRKNSKRLNFKRRNTKRRNTKRRNTKRRNTKRRNTKRRNTKRRNTKHMGGMDSSPAATPAPSIQDNASYILLGITEPFPTIDFNILVKAIKKTGEYKRSQYREEGLDSNIEIYAKGIFVEFDQNIDSIIGYYLEMERYANIELMGKNWEKKNIMKQFPVRQIVDFLINYSPYYLLLKAIKSTTDYSYKPNREIFDDTIDNYVRSIVKGHTTIDGILNYLYKNRKRITASMDGEPSFSFSGDDVFTTIKRARHTVEIERKKVD